MDLLAPRVIAVALALAPVAGCYRPTLGECSIACSADHACPDDLHCNALGVCEGATACVAADGGVPVGDFAELGTGAGTTCGIKTDGTLWCWGDDSLGQTGNGTGASPPFGTPAQVGLVDTWSGLSVGSDHACAVQSGATDGVGELWCWGSNDNGRLGTGAGNEGAPERVNAEDDWFAVAAGGSQTCALRGTPGHGDLWCWGLGDGGQLADMSNVPHEIGMPALAMTNQGMWAQVAAGTYHSCAIDDSARLYCWGFNLQNQVGDGNTSDINVPTEIGVGHIWTQVVAGEAHSCALTDEGEAFCWGASDVGQCGDAGTAVDGRVPTPTAVVTSDRFKWISAGRASTCAVTLAGDALCWGADDFGQLGDGKNHERAVPTTVIGAAGSKRISAGRYHGCALGVGGGVVCWGENDFGQLGRGVVGLRSQPVEVTVAGTGWTDVAAGYHHTCAIRAAGELWCWGRNDQGEIGDATEEQRPRPVRIANQLSFSKVYAGAFHTCAITDTDRLYCWGDNYTAQLGLGGNEDRFEPISVGTASWDSLGLGEYGSAGLQTDGTLYAWGGFWGAKEQPTLVPGSANYRSIAGSAEEACAVRNAGQIDCWIPPMDIANPALMAPFGDTGMTWQEVAHGDRFVCARNSDGEVWCAGDNQSGQAAPDSVMPMIDSFMPVDVGGGADLVQVVTGRAYGCVLHDGGTLTCWGDNASGQLGQGLVGGNQLAGDVAGFSFRKVAAGERHVCAIGKDPPNALYCWGANGNGELGNGEGGDALAAPVVSP